MIEQSYFHFLHTRGHWPFQGNLRIVHRIVWYPSRRWAVLFASIEWGIWPPPRRTVDLENILLQGITFLVVIVWKILFHIIEVL